MAENEIYDTFAIIYRRYKILKQSEVGEYFFKETSDLVNKLCDDFEKTVREENSWTLKNSDLLVSLIITTTVTTTIAAWIIRAVAVGIT